MSHQRLRQHYFRVMPKRRWHRASIWIVFWITSGIILAQLIYPPDRTLPLATIHSQPRAWQSEASVAAEINQLFMKTKVQLVAGDSTVEVPLKTFGAEPDTAAMSARLTNYPFWQRYLPLSIFLHKPSVNQATVTYTNLVAQPACAAYARQLTTAPTNAQISIKDAKLVTTKEVPGLKVDGKELCHSLQTQQLNLGETTKFIVPTEIVKPAVTADDLAKVRQATEAALDNQLEFGFEDEVYLPPRPVMASWLTISGTANQPELQLDRRALRDYLETINKQIGSPAGNTKITVVDGVEVGREVGRSGKEINYEQAIDHTLQQLLGQDDVETINLELVTLHPTLIYNNRYTNTEPGLAAYVTDVARQHNAHISIRQLDGEAWQVGAREDESIPSASTYKLYVAMWLFDEMAARRTTWNSPMLDTNVSDCFDRMTIASTNPCAVEWLARFGRNNMNSYLYAKGFSKGTTFTHPLATHTTAADLTDYMTRLAEGSLYEDIYRQRLYQSLSAHPYRYGIAAGSAGQVYDKVGFLWDYVHDTAIVNHPKGRYVMTIMTKGQSYARIASITREVERIMYGG